jgi:hypothetical protein
VDQRRSGCFLKRILGTLEIADPRDEGGQKPPPVFGKHPREERLRGHQYSITGRTSTEP